MGNDSLSLSKFLTYSMFEFLHNDSLWMKKKDLVSIIVYVLKEGLMIVNRTAWPLFVCLSLKDTDLTYTHPFDAKCFVIDLSCFEFGSVDNEFQGISGRK